MFYLSIIYFYLFIRTFRITTHNCRSPKMPGFVKFSIFFRKKCYFTIFKFLLWRTKRKILNHSKKNKNINFINLCFSFFFQFLLFTTFCHLKNNFHFFKIQEISIYKNYENIILLYIIYTLTKELIFHCIIIIIYCSDGFILIDSWIEMWKTHFKLINFVI